MRASPERATGANRDRPLSCEVGGDNVQHSCRWREQLRGGRLRWVGRAIYFGWDPMLCFEIRERTAPESSEFHALPSRPSRLAMFARPFWDRVRRDTHARD